MTDCIQLFLEFPSLCRTQSSSSQKYLFGLAGAHLPLMMPRRFSSAVFSGSTSSHVWLRLLSFEHADTQRCLTRRARTTKPCFSLRDSGGGCLDTAWGPVRCRCRRTVVPHDAGVRLRGRGRVAGQATWRQEVKKQTTDCQVG